MGLIDWEERDGLTFYKGRIYIPKTPELRTKIVHLCHDSQSTGHPGRHGTLELVSQLYWWPGMTHFINKYVSAATPVNAANQRAIHAQRFNPTTFLTVHGKQWAST